MDQVFNECSLSGAHSNKYTAIVAMNHVCQASVALVGLGFSRSIKTTEDFTTRELASDYTFYDWLADKSVSQEERTFMRSRCSQSPYVEKLCEEHSLTELEEYVLDGEFCKGLALAHLWGIPSLSLDGDARFSSDHALITRLSLSDTGSLEENCQVLLIKNKANVEKYEQSIRDALFPALQNGNDILANATHALPYLTFCGNALSQLPKITVSDPYFSIILRILRALNDAMRAVDGGAKVFLPQGIHYVKYESDTTSQMPSTKRARAFMCPDGYTRYFAEHVRINIAKRIQLYAEIQQKRVYIGHIGEHLPTARY